MVGFLIRTVFEDQIGMNRRSLILIGVGMALVMGVGVVAVSNFIDQPDQKVTLRSRILAFDKARKPQTKEQIDEIVEQMMAEYFQLGMSEEECVRILLANDLKVDERHTNERDSRVSSQRVYFNPTIVAVIHRPTSNPLVSFDYILILRFTNGKLAQIRASFVGTGP